MRVPLSWLRSYCDPGLPAGEIADLLTGAGLEVARIDRVGVGEGPFLVGRVLHVEQHPDADRLRVCAVDDGSGEGRTIVCGAPNVDAGQTVALALPGAVMPDGTRLGEAEFRGVRSSGMILAEDELAIGEDHAGILELPPDWPVGDELRSHLAIADEVLELEVNPNRPDALGVYGVARDLHALTGAPLAEDPTERDVEPGPRDGIPIEIADPDICLRFTGRVFEDVRMGESPPWLKQRLTAAGQRPISNVVDITNYVMLTTAQPLHAFDLDEVRGGRIIVRRAEQGETMVTLDDVERRFDPDMALVCDAEGPSGIAGIMGGQVSEVSEKTTRVLMEAATWVGSNILRSSKRLPLRTEASARFEKQLHPEQAMAAQRLAARLMTEVAGARTAGETIDVYPRPVPPRTVRLRPARQERLLGKRIDEEESAAILERLGFESEGPESWRVPFWRDSDVQREADMIEEVARVHGLDRLPATLPARREATGGLTGHAGLRRRLEDALRHRGLYETVSYSFIAPAALDRLRLGEGDPALAIANPLSTDQSVMRPLLLPGLLDAARHNNAHDRPDLALFESAHVYRPSAVPPPRSGDGPQTSPRGVRPSDEHHHLGALMLGTVERGWRSRSVEVDFHVLRGVLEAVLAAAGVEWRAEPALRPYLHPGRTAAILAGEREIGWLGELHPLAARGWDLGGHPGGAFELDVDALAVLAVEAEEGFRDVTSFPAVLQDIAVVVPEEVPAQTVQQAVAEGGGELLRRARVFDVFRGEQLGAGHKSLALRLEFRAPDRTLTDEEVAARRSAIEGALARIGGRLRA
ncbi:MAG TPA: phenylalanine--tRNA ligase subunit beta [Thermoleophilaceae bacterium]|nr:phenylalanine--tRNA ligase subunit beta [Thermoleophilaceae bacterium]